MNNINFDTFLYGYNYPIVKWEENENIDFYIEQRENIGVCPNCGWECFSIKEKHSRKIQDTPIHNKNVYIHIDVCEFKCKNPNCCIKTFTEKLPFAGKNQVRTYALTDFILIHAIYMSSSSASLILSLIGVDVSADTIDKLLKGVDIKDNPDVEMIGIDDVSMRKGISYATAIYDLETHHLIALLEGREKEDIIPWLKNHSKIIIVARDRASAYAEAISEVLPNAIQIADRFHLFENLIKYLKDMFYSELSDKIVIKDNEIKDKATKVLKELNNIDENYLNCLNYTNEPPVDAEGNIINFYNYIYDMNDELHTNQAKRRLEKYEKVVNIRHDSSTMSIDELIAKYKCCKESIKKYISLTSDEVEQIKLKRNYNLTKENKFSKFANIVFKMLKDNQPYEYIIAYILKSGYSGKIVTLKSRISIIAKNNGFNNIKFSKYNIYEYAADETIITRLELLKYILTINPTKLNNNNIETNLKIIEDKYPIVKEIKTIFKDFHDVVFSKDETSLDIFIELYQDKLSSFCNGLKKDIAAVKNAISDSINSGFVEGNNNKFKLIKRIVYGKQKLVNLFKRCYLAFTSTLDDLSLLKLAIAPFSQ